MIMFAAVGGATCSLKQVNISLSKSVCPCSISTCWLRYSLEQVLVNLKDSENAIKNCKNMKMFAAVGGATEQRPTIVLC